MTEPPLTWRLVALSDLARYTNGRATKPSEAQAHGTLVVKIRELNSGVSGSSVRIADSAIDDRHRISRGDLLFAWSASVGIYVWDGEDAALNQHIWKVRAKAGVDQQFLQYCLEGELRTLEAAAAERRTTMGHVRKADLSRLLAPVPPMPEQRALAEVLGSLDDRIKWSRKTAAKVLQTLQVLAEGGSRSVPVAGLATFVNGGAFTKDADGEGRIIIKIAELSSGSTANAKRSTVDAKPERIANAGDILFSWSATLDVYRWVGEQALINQHIFKVIPNGLPAWLVYAKLAEAMPAFQKIAADRATTMGHIKKSHLSQVIVKMPTDSELASLHDAGSALWDKHLQLLLEAQALERTRDTLLPELVTGRLRIPDVDGFLDRAGLAAA